MDKMFRYFICLLSAPEVRSEGPPNVPTHSAVAQLRKQSIPTAKDPSSNPAIGIFLSIWLILTRDRQL